MAMMKKDQEKSNGMKPMKAPPGRGNAAGPGNKRPMPKKKGKK